MSEAPIHQPEDIRKYYDANTEAFIRFGEGGQTIHRAVWGPGVSDKASAFRYLDRRLLAEIPASPEGATPRILDLGCGVGASLLWLSREARASGVGVTISPVQARIARATIEANHASRVSVLEASFTALPENLGEFDLVFSIEAFIHSPTPLEYLKEAARHVRPGGKLVLIDDFLTDRGARTEARRELRWLDEVRRGWMASSLISVAQLAELAAPLGLEVTARDDLTPYLELRRPRDLLMTALVSVGRHFPIPGERWRAWVGGNALQMALTRGLIEYRVVVLERPR